MRRAAPGVRAGGCVSRQSEALGDPEAGAAAPVIQGIYSDGLTYVSVFIEPYRPARHTKPMFAAMGATSTLSQRHGEKPLTA